MNENIKVLLKKVAEDNDLASRMNACKTPDEAYAVASEAVSGFTKEEFVSAMEKIRADIESSRELSDEDLSQVAGGADEKTVVTAVFSTVTASTATIFIASASAI